jgi:hypothetical protein
MSTTIDRATSSDVSKRFGHFYDEAMTHPIEIERNGAARVIMMPSSEYRRLALLDHVAVSAKDLTDDDFKAIRDAQYPEGYDHLNALMDDA